MAEAPVIVVGGGVVGVSTAYYLAKRGRPVVLLEQGELCSGSSQGNAGQITPGHLPVPQPGTMQRNLRWLLSRSSPLYIPLRFDPPLWAWLFRFVRACNPGHLERCTEMLCRLGRASAALFEQLAEQFEFGYQRRGRLEVCRSKATFGAAAQEADLMSRFGFQARLLPAEQVRELEPALTGPVAGAVYYSDSACCNPQRFVTGLAQAATKLGADIRTKTPVTDLVIRRGRLHRVVAGAEQLEASWAVLACGSWPPPLPQRLGLNLPLQPGKGYHLDIDLPARPPQIPMVLMQERIFMARIDDFLRLAGTMELSGFNLRDDPVRVQMLADGAERYVPGIRAAPVRSRWCHLRPMSPDGLPIIGPVPRLQNVWLATGHGMLGLTQGPVTGQLVAEAILDGRPSIDLTPLRPDRF